MAQKILLIDDDAGFVEKNKSALRNAGFEVSEAYSGRQGLEKADAEEPDLVVLNVMMDSVDEGFEAARQIRKAENHRHLPLIMLTSIHQQESFRFKFTGDDDWNPLNIFMEKPLKPENLVEKVKEILDK